MLSHPNSESFFSFEQPIFKIWIQQPKYNQILMAPHDCVKVNIKLFDILWQGKVNSDYEMFCGVDQKLSKKKEGIYELFLIYIFKYLFIMNYCSLLSISWELYETNMIPKR